MINNINDDGLKQAYRKGYRAGHQKGRLIAHPRKSREYQGTKAKSVIEEFISRLPASSSRCTCLSCKIINQKYADLKKEDL